METIRVILLAFFTLITARMFGELPSCFGNAYGECGYGLIVIIPFLLSTYFIDSVFVVLNKSEEVKNKALNVLFCVPYLIFALFVIIQFFASISIVTIEYALSFHTVYVAIIYAAIYFLNLQEVVRKLNTVFMVSLLITGFIFYLI